MPDYTIELKNEKIKLYNRFSWFVIAGNFFFFIYLVLVSSDKNIRGASLASLILLISVFLLQQYFKRTVWRLGQHAYFIFILVFWIGIENYWLAGAMLLFDILHTISIRPLNVIVSEKQILYPSYPAKKIEWASLNNIILKDSLLTIDFKNNKIIQQTTDESKTSINEKDFNEFCRQQLSKQASI